MRIISLTSPRRRRSLAAGLTLALAALALPGAPALAQTASPAVGAAQAQGTPVIKPPVKRVKPLTCKVTRRIRGCVARRSTCTTTNRVRKCVNATARCRLSGRVKRCTITNITCTRSPTRANRCRRTSVKKTATQAFAVRAGLAIPRFLARPVADALPAAAAATKLVSSRPGARAATPMVPVATTQQPSASGVGAGIGALVLASTLMALILIRRRPRGDR